MVGDVNQKNVMVSARATVQFVDCDSFQVRSPSGKIYRCGVGVPEYTPPELQGRSFKDFDRHPHHDLFGLAVLVFHLLMMGRHPFSGVYSGHGDMPLEKAIQGGHFAYARDSRATRMSPPPNTLPVTILDASLLQLFERAFLGQATQKRPSAMEWKQALDGLMQSLTKCRVDPRHVYPGSAAACPWCYLTGTAGILFFLPGVQPAGATGRAVDVAALWEEIGRLSFPPTDYQRPRPTVSPQGRPVPASIPPVTRRPVLLPTPTMQQTSDRFLLRMAQIGFAVGLLLLPLAAPVALVCLIGFGGWWAYYLLAQGHHRRQAAREFDRELAKVNAANEALKEQWRRDNAAWRAEYKRREAELANARAKLVELEEAVKQAGKTGRGKFETWKSTLSKSKVLLEEARREHTRAIEDLSRQAASLQLAQHLDTFLIRDAKLKGISGDRLLSLGSFGIETALDVDMLPTVKVPGIGPVLGKRLIDWRNDLARDFKPQSGVPRAERDRVDQMYLGKIRQQEAFIAEGARQLREVAETYKARRTTLLGQVEDALRRLAVAEADFEVMQYELATAGAA